MSKILFGNSRIVEIFFFDMPSLIVLMYVYTGLLLFIFFYVITFTFIWRHFTDKWTIIYNLSRAVRNSLHWSKTNLKSKNKNIHINTVLWLSSWQKQSGWKEMLVLGTRLKHISKSPFCCNIFDKNWANVEFLDLLFISVHVNALSYFGVVWYIPN